MTMTARKKKSKRRFDASFGEKLPDPLIFFLDRAIGKKFVGKKGWIVFTKDRKIRYRDSVVEIVKKRKIRMFILSRGNLSGHEIVQRIINALPAIKKFIFKHPPPFIVSITRSGNLLPIELSND